MRLLRVLLGVAIVAIVAAGCEKAAPVPLPDWVNECNATACVKGAEIMFYPGNEFVLTK